MSGSRAHDRRVPRSSVSLLGTLLSALPLAHVLTSGRGYALAALEVAPPALLLLGVVAYGLHVGRHGRDTVATVATACAVGALAGGVVSGWVLGLTALGGVPRPDPLFDVSATVALGAALGTAGGSYAARLRARTAELAAANERLDEFAGVVSHDLRNPLTVAEGRVELARETGDVSHLDAAHRALDRIESIVDASLELARTGADAGDREPVAVGAVARAAADTVSTATVAVDAAELTLDADRERLRTLFENCFRNSVEHGGVDAPAIDVGVLGDADDPDGFFVADDGRGVPEPEREDVFARGYSTADGGTGLGLAVVGGVAESHGWTPSVVESDAGGARFEFRVE
ncbi:sensor histidine kinase [Halobaculum lipolyticum]|uniref:histidine kinase n=1 Tax=Halobaculum lipolyticum TaxID=3032001 RepID=A0ABD5W7X1_9EURY|nr:ATP-binding protein [Halobaculum sp. DT31]